MPDADVCPLFEGNFPIRHNSRSLLGHLRAAAGFGAIPGSVGTGAFALAQAGLIASEPSADVVLHWEAVPTFAERFTAARPLNQIFLRQNNRVHCAGGVAAGCLHIAEQQLNAPMPPVIAGMVDLAVGAMAGEIAEGFAGEARVACIFGWPASPLWQALIRRRLPDAAAFATAPGIRFQNCPDG